jgi:hypothetical protein
MNLLKVTRENKQIQPAILVLRIENETPRWTDQQTKMPEVTIEKWVS